MFEYINKFFRFLIVGSIMVISAACSTPPAIQSPVAAAPAVITPKVIDIVGIHEWKPSQEGTLICALERDNEKDLVYTWSAEQGTIKGEGKQVTWTAPDSTGAYSITVQVSNSAGNVTFRKSFKVTDDPYGNDTPDTTIYLGLTIPSSSVVSQSAHPRIWTSSEIECVVEGKDPAELTYRWTAPTGKLAGNGLSEGMARKVGWISPGVAGVYKVSVIVSDKSGNTATGEVNFDVYCCHP